MTVLILGVIYGASLSLQIIILVVMCCESMPRTLSLNTKLISFTLRLGNKD